MRTINRAGLELIRRFEGFRPRAYLCPANVWTIGYGHTGDVKDGDQITLHQGEAILEVDLDRFERGVAELVKVEINDNQFSALVSLAFNIGLEALRRSTLLRKLNAGDFEGAGRQFPVWCMAAGRSLPGLVKRRAAELELFRSAP